MVAVVVTVVMEGTVDVEAVEGLAVLARTPPGSASAPAKATTADGVVAVAAVPMAAAVATVPMAATVELVRCVALHCIPFHCVVMRAVVRRHGAGGGVAFLFACFRREVLVDTSHPSFPTPPTQIPPQVATSVCLRKTPASSPCST